MRPDQDEPTSVVRHFITAMNAWERAAWQARMEAREGPDPSAYQAQVRAKVEAIFRTFCTPKDRPYGRQASFQNPPEYDPAKETDIDCQVSGNRAIVDTERQAVLGGGRYRYTLRRIAGRWLIDNLKWMSGDKWVPAVL